MAFYRSELKSFDFVELDDRLSFVEEFLNMITFHGFIGNRNQESVYTAAEQGPASDDFIFQQIIRLTHKYIVPMFFSHIDRPADDCREEMVNDLRNDYPNI